MSKCQAWEGCPHESLAPWLLCADHLMRMERWHADLVENVRRLNRRLAVQILPPLSEGELHRLRYGNGRQLVLLPLLFGHVRAGLVFRGEEGRTGIAFEDVWEFPSYAAALRALKRWDGRGEPSGWHRHPKSMRRRGEDGAEYVLAGDREKFEAWQRQTRR